MSVVYSTQVKTERMQAVADQIDAASAHGYIEIGTAGMASVLATIELGNPCGVVAADVLTFSGFPRSDASAANSGNAAEARICDGNGSAMITGLTVGTSGTDVVLDSVSITAGQTVTLNSATITHAA